MSQHPGILTALAHWAQHSPHQLALADGATVLDFRALDRAIHSRADDYRHAGVQPGDRIGNALADGATALISSLAAVACGGVHVPIDHHLTADERRQLINVTHIRWLVDEHGVHNLGTARAADPLGSDSSAFLRFTSGTTGTAKGVLLSHATLHARAVAASRALELQPGERVLWLLPLAYHWAASVIATLVAGAGVVFGNRLRLSDTLAEARTHRTTLAYASPWHCQRFASVAAGGLAPLTTIVCTTAALDPLIADKIRLTHTIRLRQALGIIECGLPLISPGQAGEALGAVGKPQPGFSCRVQMPDADGSGELLIRGPGLFDAYLDPWQPASGVLSDGYFASGDRARIDGDGQVRLLGRLKDLINVGGMKVFPLEIETVLASHPAVRASHAYALPDARLGETVGVTVMLADPEAQVADELREWCRARLAPLKQPTVWEFAALTLTPSGKLRRTLTDR